MDLKWLETVRVIGEVGSISGAAERLGIAQSAVSARLVAIETSLGTELFERLPRGVTPTLAGARLLPYTRRIADLVAAARTAALGLSPAAEPFRFGATDVAAATVVPDALARIMALPSPPQLQLSTATTSELLESLDRGELDAALVSANGELRDRPHTVVGSLPLALAWLAGSQPAELRHAFGFGEGCVCTARLRVIDAEQRWGLQFTKLGSVEAILGCVRAGLGLTLLPRALLRDADQLATRSAPELRLVLAYSVERQPEALRIAAQIRQSVPTERPGRQVTGVAR